MPKNVSQLLTHPASLSLLKRVPARCTRVNPVSLRCDLRLWQCSRHTKSSFPRQSWSLRTFSSAAPKRYQLETSDPTIFALSTAPGRAAIAVIRISGPACQEVHAALCPGKGLPAPRRAVLRAIREPPSATSNGDLIEPSALAVYFPKPNSVTGDDVLEFHVHGGQAIVQAVLTAVGKCSSERLAVRYAEAGEFTQRAFMNDRLDLPQIEALGDALSAVTEEQRRLAVQGTSNDVARRYESWRSLLLHARGELEALIDFSEDQHFDESPAQLAGSVAIRVQSLLEIISYYSTNAVRGELLRNGIGISLVGSPNVGKSSILNQIVGRNAAIVSKEAGTTRDVVEVGIDLGGFFCRFGDTAGLRQTTNEAVVGEIEHEGIERAKAKALESDLVILVLSIEPAMHGQGFDLYIDDEVIQIATELLASGKDMIAVVNKLDNYGTNAADMSVRIRQSIAELLPKLDAAHVHCISCQQALQASQGSPGSVSADPGNTQALLSGLIGKFKAMTSAVRPDHADSGDPSQWEASLGATTRQRILLDTCSEHLHKFLEQVTSARAEVSGVDFEDVDIVMAAESLRFAADCLSRITGRGEINDVHEVLGVVFENFCVGK